MYYQNIYYVIDLVSQTVLGTFYAKNEAMAQKIMKGFDLKKANMDPNDIAVYYDPVDVKVYETFEDVFDKLGVGLKALDLKQKVFDFEEAKDGE